MTAPARPVGLTSAEAARRLAAHGRNELERGEATSPWRMLAGQLASPVIWLLLVAAAIAGALGELADAIAIGTIVLGNALVGLFQEYRAERAVLALRSMTAPQARVLRDGHPAVVPAAEVVPGDALLLEAGDVVAADARLIEAHRLAANEAPLTGESVPVEKEPVPADPGAPLAERRDHVFTGTSIDHVPWTQALFEIGALSAADCLLGFALGLVPVTVLELAKLARLGVDRADRAAQVKQWTAARSRGAP